MSALRTVASPVGPLVLEVEGGALTAIRFGADGAGPDPADASPGADLPGHDAEEAVLDAAVRQLEEYFAGTRTVFDLPVRASGTDFQQQVWAGLASIPYGRTWSYGQLAASIGRPAAARAIGAGCGRNPVPIVVPCHRVVGAGGSLTGYAGGTAIKSALLGLEARTLAHETAPATAGAVRAQPR